jgi:hypothetical protein
MLRRRTDAPNRSPAVQMNCDILIRTWRKDLPWVELCLAAIERYARGFRSVVVVLPRSAEPWLRRYVRSSARVRVELCRDFPDDYLGQQVTKLFADTYSDADLVCHVDSDCILSRPTTPEDLAPHGRPRVVMRPYSLLGRHWPWRGPTEEFLRWPVEHDFMQQPPFVYPRSLYSEVRAHSEVVHRQDIETYVMSRPPRGFSEFNVLGAFGRVRHPDDFIWVDSSLEDPGRGCSRWYWSWAGLDRSTRKEIEALLAVGGQS